MLTTIEVTIDKTRNLYCVEPMQAIKPGRVLLTWLEPDASHEPALMAEDTLAQGWHQPRGGCSVSTFAAGQVALLPDR